MKKNKRIFELAKLRIQIRYPEKARILRKEKKNSKTKNEVRRVRAKKIKSDKEREREKIIRKSVKNKLQSNTKTVLF